MKFSVGDKVLIKHTKEEGKIVAILNEEMVEVEVLNTRFPVFTDELDHPYLEWFTSKKMNARKRALSLDDFPSEVPAKIYREHAQQEQGFFFSLVPVYFIEADGEEQIARFKFYFINQTEYTIKLKYDCYSNLGKEFALGTVIYPYQHLYLHHVKFDMLNEKLRFEFDINSVAKAAEQKFLNCELKLQPKVVLKKLHQMEQRGEPVWSMLLAQNFPTVQVADLDVKKLFAPSPRPANSYQFKPRRAKAAEIDLHIEQLVTDYHQMSNAQKLDAQLLACEQAVLDAVQQQMPSIIIIHGIGTGVLRTEVHQLLKRMRAQVRHFENKYSQKYGFGATEVFLRL